MMAISQIWPTGLIVFSWPGATGAGWEIAIASSCNCWAIANPCTAWDALNLGNPVIPSICPRQRYLQSGVLALNQLVEKYIDADWMYESRKGISRNAPIFYQKSP
jgi:hypothetical protein